MILQHFEHLVAVEQLHYLAALHQPLSLSAFPTESKVCSVWVGITKHARPADKIYSCISTSNPRQRLLQSTQGLNPSLNSTFVASSCYK